MAVVSFLVILVIFFHLFAAWAEMIDWDTWGPKLIDFPDAITDPDSKEEDYLRIIKNMASNQGLYNLFIAAGLIWGKLFADPSMKVSIFTFFLVCVVAAGVYGGYTIKRTLYIAQAAPAALALIALAIVNM